MIRPKHVIITIAFLLSFVLVAIVISSSTNDATIYLPVIKRSTLEELRAMWVTRWDWVGNPTESNIDQIVADADEAGFNVIFFQVRGEADAFYTPGHEPWSRLLTGTLGQSPGFDPLGRMIEQAHQRNIEVHAYINVYPVWLGCDPPPDGTNPRHFYYKLRDELHGLTGDKLNGLQWNGDLEVICGSYQRATPASIGVDDHLMTVAADLVSRYNLDGLHLDHIRYAAGASCDPVSLCRYHYQRSSCYPIPVCQFTGEYMDWQRAQVNGTVEKFYRQILPLRSGMMLSAAVWR